MARSARSRTSTAVPSARRTSVRLAERAWLEARLAEGKSLEAIAREAGWSASTVGRRLAEHGLESVGKARHAPRDEVVDAALASYVTDGLSLRQVSARTGLSYTAIRHRLQRPGIRTAEVVPPDRCERHDTQLRVYEGTRRRCPRCVSEAVSTGRRQRKAVLVAEAGGACAICGYDPCNAALRFHHLDPAAKAFAISLNGVTRSLDVMRAEAAKCILLCSNCHAEVEAGVTRLPSAPDASAGR